MFNHECSKDAFEYSDPGSVSKRLGKWMVDRFDSRCSSFGSFILQWFGVGKARVQVDYTFSLYMYGCIHFKSVVSIYLGASMVQEIDVPKTS